MVCITLTIFLLLNFLRVTGCLNLYYEPSVSCIYLVGASPKVSKSDIKMFQQSRKFINIPKNESQLEKNLLLSPACLVHSLNPSSLTQSWLSRLERHLIIVEADSCRNIQASQFNVDLYCIQGGSIYEKYKIRFETVFRKVGTIDTTFPVSI